MTSKLKVNVIADSGDNTIISSNGSGTVTLGAAFPSTGKLGQVVSVTKTDTFSTTSNAFTPLTGLTANITPTATSSKILVSVNLGAVDTSAALQIFFQLYRGSTLIGMADAASNRIQTFIYQITNNNNRPETASNEFLDSPSSTSQLTYSIKCRVYGGTLYINQSSVDSDTTAYGRAISTITLMEILA